MDPSDAFEKVPFLRALSEANRQKLLPYAQIHTLERGERLWADGQETNEFSFVVRGRLKLMKMTESGRDSILEICGPGELLCASAVCSFAPYCCAAVSMEQGTEVVQVPRPDVMEMLERDGGPARPFIRELSQRNMHLCRRVEQLSAGQVEQRLAKVLLTLAARVGVERAGGGVRIPVPLSRQDLADLVGTTIETAIRTMSKLRRQGIVDTATRGIIISDRAALRELAGHGHAKAKQASNG